ncbi:hypothetical protein NUACC26_062000 [Scytonema sp. NUACC26]
MNFQEYYKQGVQKLGQGDFRGAIVNFNNEYTAKYLASQR